MCRGNVLSVFTDAYRIITSFALRLRVGTAKLCLNRAILSGSANRPDCTVNGHNQARIVWA